MENNNLADNYKHIKGWGVDADPKNEPTYPMKHWNGDDHKRLHYNRPPQQPITVEVLHSNERPDVTRVFGTSSPPSGLSGNIRRFAFKYSEGSWTHWLSLLLADRINMVEGIVEDLGKGHMPNVFAERGWTAEWKYNRKSFVTKVAIGAAIAAGAILLLSSKNKKDKGEAKNLNYQI